VNFQLNFAVGICKTHLLQQHLRLSERLEQGGGEKTPSSAGIELNTSGTADEQAIF